MKEERKVLASGAQWQDPSLVEVARHFNGFQRFTKSTIRWDLDQGIVTCDPKEEPMHDIHWVRKEAQELSTRWSWVFRLEMLHEVCMDPKNSNPTKEQKNN